MNPQSLLEQFLGPDAARSAGGLMDQARGKLNNSGMGGVAGGLAAGGVLGLLLGNKKARKSVGKLAGGAVGYGGAAVLGALAYKAYQNWQAGKQGPQQVTASGAQPAPAALPSAPPPADSKFLPANAPASDGRPFELALVLAMIAAANADGHIGPDEQKAIFDRVGQLPLDAEDKGFVFDALAKPPSLQDIANLAQGQEQAAELYLASRIAIDPDHPMEQAYLEALASRLALPGALVQHLEGQVQAALA
ncbi:tellurite resistance TerB family protein [Pelagibius sp. 7325]|uniref:tellurite resistance TerB family protein n=1 Tax=Pelagibius sp. 7325 TaxID=3131994 RepID=UPI0030EE01DC